MASVEDRVTARIGDPDLWWRTDACGRPVPASARFDDRYFSDRDGLAETRHVFLAGCGLPEAWRAARRFTILEAGFGSGLNFAATWALWSATAPASASLDYVSIEGFPMSAEQIRATLAGWPELAAEAAALTARLPNPHPGTWRIPMPGGRVSLTLLYGEAAERLAAYDCQADAVFLDGFAPSKNPDMWRPEILDLIARHAAPGARLASFTAAGDVRRGLEAVGFAVDRRSGHAGKRDTIAAGLATPRPEQDAAPMPFSASGPASGRGACGRPVAAVVGGGIAGCATAEALARRGVSVILVEDAPRLAAGASGNPVGIVMPRPTAGRSPAGEFHCAAFRLAVHRLSTLRSASEQPIWQPVGALEIEADADRLGKVVESGALSRAEMRVLTGTATGALADAPLDATALWYPTAGIVRPEALCKSLAQDCDILTGRRVASIDRLGNGWALSDPVGAGILRADIVVLASGVGLARIAQAAWLPLTPRRGQITALAASTRSRHLSCVLTRGGYVLPAEIGPDGTPIHWVGASYGAPLDPERPETAAIVPGETEANRAMAETTFPELKLGQAVADRAATRATTPDRLPLAGPLPDRAVWPGACVGDRTGLPDPGTGPAAVLHGLFPGLFVVGGLGSRGLTTAFLCAEIVAAQATGGAPPTDRALCDLVHPGRFILRNLKRGKT